MVVLKTNKKIEKIIDSVKNSETWKCEGGKLLHDVKSEQWQDKGYFVYKRTGEYIEFDLKDCKEDKVYGTLHGRLVEMLMNYFMEKDDVIVIHN